MATESLHVSGSCTCPVLKTVKERRREEGGKEKGGAKRGEGSKKEREARREGTEDTKGA